MNLRATLERRIAAALQAAGADGAPALVAPSARPQFGDYQANGCMAAAKKMGVKPRQLAEAVAAKLDLSDIAEKVEVAGAGFLNIFLRREWIETQLGGMTSDDRLSVPAPEKPQTVVVDYSGPNLAKEMHVGHLRSTIIGDALARTLLFCGYKVRPQNHVGDWGTQFGMLIAYLEEFMANEGWSRAHFEILMNPRKTTILQDMEEFYRRAKERYDTDPDFAQRSRDYVVRLQQGDSEVHEDWRYLMGISLTHCEQVYERLGVLLQRSDVHGESSYNADLPKVVADLEKAGLLSTSEGAKGVFLPEFTNKDNERAFVIVQKSDGGYLYATTDLAAIRYRVQTLGANRVLYVTDSRQAQHFAQIFLIAHRAGFAPESVSLEHVPFGMMLGTDGRPFKTREGTAVKLMDLLDEAEKRAADLVRQKNPDLDDARAKEIARVVGIGALKYADLSQNRASDYVFSWDKMLSLEGNTAPYMQYAYARIRSIFRKGISDFGFQISDLQAHGGPISISESAERALAVKLLQFPETVQSVAEACLPNVLCAYLYDLAGAFMGFYENCPVLKADEPTRSSRLALCDLTARVIQKGLELLGIETLEKM